jgi:4a-hydroxytetrahydrobiopterin dehydratase
MKRELLNTNELTTALKTLNGWTVEGKTLRKDLKFPNFAEALAYVNRVGALAEAADHHPDITFGWGYARLALTTHDRGGITDVDIALAKEIDSVTGQ